MCVYVHCCVGLPCLLSLTSIGDILVHSLPKLQHLVTVPYLPLKAPRYSSLLTNVKTFLILSLIFLHRALHTFQVSGDGQAVYFTSPSEIQRLSVTRDDHLNHPECLPELYVERPDPEPAQAGGILSWVKGSGTKVDRDELCE